MPIVSEHFAEFLTFSLHASSAPPAQTATPPPKFPALLKDYCEQTGEAIRNNRHHDTRRHLFLNFLREAFGINPLEIELEHNLKSVNCADGLMLFIVTLLSK
ncbi:MAG TPA: hypothetical protein VIK59_08320 [Verrucomicrobiae bacterium]